MLLLLRSKGYAIGITCVSGEMTVLARSHTCLFAITSDSNRNSSPIQTQVCESNTGERERERECLRWERVHIHNSSTETYINRGGHEYRNHSSRMRGYE